ncbi:hypothetical protein HDU97_005681 [Phlyctochytrium planicorne]|nr:hypothetical protein HDU97_005681 [Phlyctochytrium planicorne]
MKSPLFPVFVDVWDNLSTKATFFITLQVPLYKNPNNYGENASYIWMDRAIVQKFADRPDMFPFEVLNRDCFLKSFEVQQPELRAAMCAFSAQQSLPRAPPSVVIKYYDEARQLCLDALENPTLGTLQALLILTLCSVALGKTMAAISFIGMAARTLEPLKMSPKQFGTCLTCKDLELLKSLAVCFLVDRMTATITGKDAYLDIELADLKTTVIQELTLQIPDDTGAIRNAKNMLTAVELSDLLYLIRKETENPMNTIEDFFSRKEELVIIESKLEDWKEFLPDQLKFERYIQRELREEDMFAEFGIARIFCFSIYHLCVCLLNRPRLKLKKILIHENPILSSNGDHEINRRLEASSSKAYNSARTLQYLVTVFKTKGVTPFQEDPIIGFSLLVSSLVLVDLMLITDGGLLDEVIQTLNQDMAVFESCVKYLGLDPLWYDQLVEIVLGNDGSHESFEELLAHLEIPYTDMMGLLLKGSCRAPLNF